LSLTPALIQNTFEKEGLASFFPPDSLPRLVRYIEKMLQINQSLNLTRWTSDEQVLVFHLLDSAFPLESLRTMNISGGRWLDLGTGCGFPGIVLAAAFPDLDVTFLDSVTKKTKALGECLQVSGCKVQTLTARAEDLGRDSRFRESWNGVTARAVADFRVVLEYAAPLLKTGGYLVNWMTQDQMKDVDNSHNALRILGCKIVQKTQYQLPGLLQPRYFVMVEKQGKTSNSYPRPAGQASKRPL
jgi:16S rRNA (guanine527-N7)-methyltransferase